ncbi:hypothetical protein SD80_027775 [Scytonema tolypothrichoides VB-61278]|nr:hypothetical protein SD80_027775 [Scytonema tolypothrichoides VB-61278]
MSDNYIKQQKQIIQQLKDSISQGQNRLSIVEMRSDYENDDAIGLASLTFPSKDIAQTISQKIITPLQSLDSRHFYYSSEELLHITIKNVRTVHNPLLFKNEDVVKVHELFTQIVPNFQSFTFRLEGLILFPTSVSLTGYCDETLRKLVQALDLGLKEIGVPDNKKYISDTVFFGNMTLCRFTDEPIGLFQNKVKELENIYIGEMRVTEISLVICNAVCHPKTKKVIGTYKLSQ